MGDRELRMAVPLDPDGFLRRECPTCQREFKWLASTEEEKASSVPDEGLCCPYCGIRADANAWFTKAQVEAMQYEVYREVVKPQLDDFAASVRETSGSFIKADVRFGGPAVPPPLEEPADMRRIDFSCHPSEPIKVIESWHEPVHCLLCGSTTLPPEPQP